MKSILALVLLGLGSVAFAAMGPVPQTSPAPAIACCCTDCSCDDCSCDTACDDCCDEACCDTGCGGAGCCG